MAVVRILENKMDVRKGGDECLFNGYLEDYLSIYEEDINPILKETFELIFKEDNNVKICVDLKLSINKEAISNQIIRYRDIFKLQGKPIVVPYILYEDKNKERGLILTKYDEYSYLFAKSYYYLMTEPGNEYNECKNELVCASSDSPEEISEVFKKLFLVSAGALQRSIDTTEISSYEELKDKAIKCSDELRASAFDRIAKLEDRTEVIYELITKWFLLKKLLYVQYMVNKDILNQVYEGNVKKQRNQAKINSELVRFISYSELYRYKEENEGGN